MIATDPVYERSAHMVRHEALKEVASAATSAVLALMGFWRISGVSWSEIGALWSRSDGVVEYAMAKTQGSSIAGLFDERLGFPNGQDWSHFPVLDMTNRLELLVLTRFLDPVTSVNLLYLLSFPVVAILMYGALRNFYVNRLLAVAGSVSFSLVGYHFDYEHPFLGNYLSIPIGLVWLALIANANSQLAQRSSQRVLVLTGIGAGAVVGLSNPQYAVFFMIVGLVAVLFAPITRRQSLSLVRRLTLYLIPAILLLGSLALGRLARAVPAVVSSTDRPVIDSYLWAGKLFSLFTVPGNSVLSAMPINQSLLNAQETTVWTGVAAIQSAFVAACSVLILLIVLILVARLPSASSDRSRLIDSVRPWAAMWLTGLAFFVTSGMGVVFAAVVYPQVRGWARMAIVLAALAIAGVLIFLSGWVRRLRREGSRRSGLLLAAFGALVTILFLDQFTARYPIQTDATTLPALEALVADAADEIAPGCPVLNIPLMSFPEAIPPGRMEAYDHMLPFLAESPWRFSYGAIRGQLGSRWTDHLAVQPEPMSEQLAAEGFCGVLIDTAGLDETVPSLDQYLDAYGPPAASAMNRWFLFALPSAEAVTQQDSLFSRPEVDYGKDFTVERLREDGLVTRWTQKEQSTLKVWNPSYEPALLLAETSLEAANCPNSQEIVVSTSNGYESELRLEPNASVQSLIPLEVPARGNVEVTFRTPDARCTHNGENVPVGVQITDLRFTRTQPDGLAISNYAGFYDLEMDEAGQTWRWINGTVGTVELFNLNSRSAEARLTGRIEVAPCAISQGVEIEIGDQFAETKVLQQGIPLDVDLPVRLNAFGKVPVQIRALSPACESDRGARFLGPRVLDLQMTGASAIN